MEVTAINAPNAIGLSASLIVKIVVRVRSMMRNVLKFKGV